MKSEKWYAAMAARRGKGANQYTKAKELGLPPPTLSEEQRRSLSERAKQKRHSEETKEKIRQRRIAYLRENPDKVPYKLNHYSKGRSYPEEYWNAILESNGLEYTEQYQIGPYQLDFAFLEAKIDLEIDGDQHYLDERIVQSDKRRNAYLENLGWKIIRVRWSEYKNIEDKRAFVATLLKTITDQCPERRRE